jgi:hypothetical protein
MMNQNPSIETTTNPLDGPVGVRIAEKDPHPRPTPLMVDDSTPWEEIEMELVRIKERYRL